MPGPDGHRDGLVTGHDHGLPHRQPGTINEDPVLTARQAFHRDRSVDQRMARLVVVRMREDHCTALGLPEHTRSHRDLQVVDEQLDVQPRLDGRQTEAPSIVTSWTVQ